MVYANQSQVLERRVFAFAAHGQLSFIKTFVIGVDNMLPVIMERISGRNDDSSGFFSPSGAPL